MNALQRLRAAGYTRQEIAKALGVSKGAVGHWENGIRFPGRDAHGGIVKLAEAKGIRLLAEDFHEAQRPKRKPARRRRSTGARR